MTERRPRLVASIATLMLLAACGDNPAPQAGPPVEGGDPVNFVTTNPALAAAPNPISTRPEDQTAPNPAASSAMASGASPSEARSSGPPLSPVETPLAPDPVPPEAVLQSTVPQPSLVSPSGVEVGPGPERLVSPPTTGPAPPPQTPGPATPMVAETDHSSAVACPATTDPGAEYPAGCSLVPMRDGEPVFWHPDLQEEAFQAINPHAVGAHIWYEQLETADTAPHRFYRFYYMHGSGDQQTEMWRHWMRTLDLFWASPIIYYPVRYDLSWHDYPNTVRVLATWPLGEQREILVADGEPLADIELPPPPPLPPTTPYTEPVFPQTATSLGRDCPPVEQLWAFDAPVQDPCTLAAVQTAFQYAFAAATPQQTQAAVRDGHVLAHTVRQHREIAARDSFFAYWFNPDNPGHYLAEARNVRWAGRFAGASLINAEYRLYALPGLAPPRIQALTKAAIQDQIDRGIEVHEWARGEKLPTEPPPPEVGFWDRMLLVRTADGTWRMSYPMWCDSMEIKITYESVTCPDDPNPVWSDWIWDFDLYPPHDRNFWLNATPEQKTYRGVPPS